MDFSDTPPIVPNCLLDRCADPDPETGPVAPAGPRTMALGLTRGYASAWKVPDALRELYQNWKDAILQAHPEISLLNFEPKYSVTKDKNVITFVVERPPSVEPVITGPSSVLGFIRFDVLQGRAEFANLGTTLGENCLELGHSTKTGDDGRLAGGHGEGLKLAALVLSRHGHHVRISTNGCHWTFNFNGSKKSNFYCRIAPSKAKREAAPSGPPAEAAKLTASVWEDVCVTIDGTSKGQRLAYTDFCAWVQRTVDLHPSVHRIRTTAGELLLNPEHQGQVYLKGIRVNHQSLDTRAFHCGYVLAHGRVDRDRQRLVDPLQARESIHAIWQEAIHKDEARALPRYLELLLTHPSSADVAGAGQQVPERTARKLWGLLRQRAERENTFFCSQARQHADAFLIQSELQKEPRALPDLLWDALRRYGLLRDPLEELRHRLQNADAIQVPQTAVAQGVARTLRALLALSTSTARTQIVFVRCETHAVDVAYQPDRYRLYIHERWLHTPPETPCGAHSSGRSALLWPQIAEELYHRAMTIITSPSGASARLSDAVLRARLQRAHQKLREMPRLIRHQQTAEGQVVSFATGHGLDYVELCSTQVYYLVVLHHVGCPATGSLLYDPGRDTCPCPRQVTALGTRKATFSGLGDRSWVPMICKAQGLHGEDTDSCVPADLQGEGGALIGSSFTTLPPPPASGQPHSVDGRPPRLWTPQDGAVPSSNDCQKGPVGEHSQWAPNPVDKTVNKPPTPSLDECRLQSPPYGHHAGHERMSQSIESVGGAVRMPANSTEGLAAEPVAEPRAAPASCSREQ
ncbi:hypothetical protein BDQ94DRAFT_176607 [Aspergillus welwitschiae]|uniref:Histidine kinase-like ATPase n=1 Tax=Aspergillus welwitschiae TaxID=1341132 RepID=A0A3F3PH02_9EURO|nr:hypothetical protein BDQ94DRAFT_176607 [Aspergillus welwitschiae]RDH26149.1 hypothetical protein BDQ94DRAFT_176607 [Aspergillus welwitschiae]